MKLDTRIIEGKRPLTCFDTEEAKKFIEKECYFSDDPEDFKNLDDCQKENSNEFKTLLKNYLYRVQDTEKPFLTDTVACYKYAYCLPCEWVREHKEPEWRPFSLTEWRNTYGVGYGVMFRIKDSDTSRECLCCGLFSDHDDDLPGKGVISLGGELFVLQNLFDQFELRKNNEWQPFGVIDEDKEQIK